MKDVLKDYLKIININEWDDVESLDDMLQGIDHDDET